MIYPVPVEFINLKNVQKKCRLKITQNTKQLHLINKYEMKKNIVILSIIVTIGIMVMVVPGWAIETVPGWLYYDNGIAANPSSLLKYQGVRFSLPDGVVKTQLLTIRFYYSCSGSCLVTIHITGHDHKTALTKPINYLANNSWNELDVSGYNIFVSHNFYIILKNLGSGSPDIDNKNDVGRSFKGRYLSSMNTSLSHNLLIRAELGFPISIPALKEWDMSITEKIKVRIQGHGSETNIHDYSEKWILYTDGSFATERYLYGIWKQKGSKYIVSLDPEDMIDSVEHMFDGHIANVKVARINFTWKETEDGTIKGSYKIYAGAFFKDYNDIGTIILQGNFIGTPN